MSIIPQPTPTSLAALLSLLNSPGLKYGVGQFKKMLPYGAGPFLPGAPLQHNNNQPGATPVIRQYNGPGFDAGSVIGSALDPSNWQKPDPLQTLYDQLLNQLQTPVQAPTGVNQSDLMKQVQDALNPIYDQRAKEAKNQSALGRGEVKNMYRALANDYERLAPEQVKQSKEAQKQVEQLYGQLRSNIEGSYSRVSNEQADLFKQLGIEDALPAVMDKQDPAVTDALTAASENQAQQQQRYMDIGQEDATYYREGSPLATMTGNEIQTGMLNDLQNYLDKIEAERTSGIQSGYLDQLGKAQNLLGQQQQDANSENARRQQMLWQILQSQLQGNNNGQQPSPLDSFMGNLPKPTQQAVAEAFTKLQRSPEAIYGKVQDPRNPVPGTFVETTPQWYMAQADAMLQHGQIDPVTHQALLMYLQLYFGNK